ncbi:MAG TPA: hypothetical protein VF605_11080 [Allosphingosinicella sp.]
MLALLLAACTAAACPPPESAERTELRERLWPIAKMSPCPGPPTPRIFQARHAALHRGRGALLERVRGSPLAEDLARINREQQELERIVNEGDCAVPFWNRPEDPENIATYPALLEAKERELQAAEAAFARASAACPPG